MEISSINLDNLYASLQGIIRPPLKKVHEVEEEPIVLAAVKEACYWLAKSLGWEFKGEIPKELKKAVVIIAPHTSMLDLIFGMASYRKFNILKGHYLAKKELFKGPFKFFYEKTGGIPVERGEKNNMVEQVAAFFADKQTFFLAIAPEGTRSFTDKWKTGFYRIAMQADVPIVMAYLDYDKKEAGSGKLLHPSGKYEKDAKIISNDYKNINAFWLKKWN